MRVEHDGEDAQENGHGEYQRDEEPELPRSPGQDLPATARDGQPEPRQHSGEPGIRSAQRVLDPGQGPPFGRREAHGPFGPGSDLRLMMVIVSVLTQRRFRTAVAGRRTVIEIS